MTAQTNGPHTIREKSAMLTEVGQIQLTMWPQPEDEQCSDTQKNHNDSDFDSSEKTFELPVGCDGEQIGHGS